ncbi:MAG: hypothetical protein LUP97_08635, partial [Methanoregula sp.]|nr:hypothetical protein [Methanoregula sp.]
RHEDHDLQAGTGDGHPADHPSGHGRPADLIDTLFFRCIPRICPAECSGERHRPAMAGRALGRSIRNALLEHHASLMSHLKKNRAVVRIWQKNRITEKLCDEFREVIFKKGDLQKPCSHDLTPHSYATGPRTAEGVHQDIHVVFLDNSLNP